MSLQAVCRGVPSETRGDERGSAEEKHDGEIIVSGLIENVGGELNGSEGADLEEKSEGGRDAEEAQADPGVTALFGFRVCFGLVEKPEMVEEGGDRHDGDGAFVVEVSGNEGDFGERQGDDAEGEIEAPGGMLPFGEEPAVHGEEPNPGGEPGVADEFTGGPVVAEEVEMGRSETADGLDDEQNDRGGDQLQQPGVEERFSETFAGEEFGIGGREGLFEVERAESENESGDAPGAEVSGPASMSEEEHDGEGDPGFDGVEEEGVAEDIDGGDVEGAADESGDPQLILHLQDSLRVIEPEIERDEDAGEEGEGLAGHAITSSEDDSPA